METVLDFTCLSPPRSVHTLDHRCLWPILRDTSAIPSWQHLCWCNFQALLSADAVRVICTQLWPPGQATGLQSLPSPVFQVLGPALSPSPGLPFRLDQMTCSQVSSPGFSQLICPSSRSSKQTADPGGRAWAHVCSVTAVCLCL